MSKANGKFSRDKGKRNEYALRDFIRKQGYTAHRVPSSGAAQGAKGDVTYEKADKKGRLELKARRDEYKTIYALYDTFKDKDANFALVTGGDTLQCVSIHPDLDSALGFACVYYPEAAYKTQTKWVKGFTKTVQKLLKMKELLGEADILVVKNDHKPFLFIRYR